MFFLKKLLGPLLFPMPFVVILMVTGLVLIWFTKKEKLGKVLLTTAAILLVSLSFGFTRWVLSPLEQQYPPLLNPSAVSKPEAPVKWVVVLGGGGAYNPQLPSTSQLSAATMVRLVEGIRLHRQIPGSKIIVSEGNQLPNVAIADVMSTVAQELGVPAEDIVLDKESQDTENQAIAVKPLVGQDRFILVTSASHMPRAMALFRKVGTDPIPAPTEFGSVSSPGSFRLSAFYPNAAEIRRLELGMHEYMGLVWAKARGKI